MYTLERSERAFFVLCVLLYLSIFLVPALSFAETMEERRARLEQELATIEQDISQKRGVLSEKQKERTTLERDIAILDNEIAIAQQQIKHRDITISKIRDDIGDKQTTITELDKKVARSSASLQQILRRTREIDDTSLTELILSGSLTDLLRDLDDFQTIQRALDASFDEIAMYRSDLSARKQALEEQRGD